MRQALKAIKCKLKSAYSYLSDLVSSYAPGQEIGAFRGWLRKYPGYVAALVLIVLAVWSAWNFLMVPETKRVEHLRLQARANSPLYKKKLEQKNQRLAAALSHLEANPQIKTPGNHQSLIGPYAKMEWKYGTTENGQNLSSHKDSILKIQKANIVLDGKRSAVTGEAIIEWQDNNSGDGVRQNSSKHSIIEIKNAADPLIRDKAIKVLVAGEAAWYPIALSETLGDGGTFLWRVIEGEMDASGRLRAEGSWGAYSVFTIYRSAYERIKATKTIRIGTYNVGQVKFESKDSAFNEPCPQLSDISSEKDRDVLCEVIKSSSIIGTFGKLTPVVKRYSDIDRKLLRDLKAGELDIAFGNISKAAYREGKGIHFVEYAPSEPVLLTNDEKKRNKQIGREDKICAVQGTVYEYVLRKLEKTNPGRYRFEVCQNTIDAIDKLLNHDIQWFVMMGGQPWETEIKPKHRDKLFQNTKSNLVRDVPKDKDNEIKGDAFAITDLDLHDALCPVLRKMGKNRDCKTLVSPNSPKEGLPSGVGS